LSLTAGWKGDYNINRLQTAFNGGRMIKRIFLALVLALVSLSFAFARADFDSLYSAGKLNLAGAEGAPAVIPGPEKAPGVIEVIKTLPLLDLMAERTVSSKELTVGATVFLASVVLDDDWEVYFQLKQKGSSANPGVWKETAFKEGVTYKFAGGEVQIIEKDGVINVTGPGAGAETSTAELFDLLYAKSTSIECGGLVTYAVIRNFTPLTGNEGTITLRMGSDGLYYYSLTPDAQVAGYPRWLSAVNGVLYGLKATDTDLVFVSKVIPPDAKPLVQMERVIKF